MIHFANNTLSIQMPCASNETPMALLRNLQAGLLDALANLNYQDAPPVQLDSAVNNITGLLRETLLSEQQADAIDAAAAKLPALRKALETAH